jgi:hypothetical protein
MKRLSKFAGSRRGVRAALLALLLWAPSGIAAFAQSDPFPSWNDGTAKKSFVDDGPGKPVGINRFIGRRRIFAFGNSDGDLQMLQWTTAGGGARFAGIVHHTDAEREYAYDRESKIGKLDKALDQATARNWSVVDMKRDWKTVFPPET